MITDALSGILLYGLLIGRLSQKGALAAAVLLAAGVWALKRFHSHSHNEFLSIDWLAQTSRWGSVNPLLKVLCSTALLFACVGSPSGSFCVVVFLLCAVLTVVGGVSLSQYLSLLRIPLTFVLLGSIGIVYGVSPHPAGSWWLKVGEWYLCVVEAAQEEAVLVMAKALGGVGCLYFLSLSTPLQEIIGTLRRLRVPSLMIELMYLIYRYIFILLEIHRRMELSARSRLGYRTYGTSLRTMAGIASQLMVLSFRRASASFDAMESRCYKGNLRFLEEEKPVKPGHLLFCGAAAILLAGGFVLLRGKGI